MNSHDNEGGGKIMTSTHILFPDDATETEVAELAAEQREIASHPLCELDDQAIANARARLAFLL